MFDELEVRSLRPAWLVSVISNGLALFAVIWLIAAVFSAEAHAFEIEGSGTVYRAVDGDTYWVSNIEPAVYQALLAESRNRDHFNDRYRSVKIRLGAVDTAESVHADAAKNTLRGQSISEHMKRVSKDQQARFRCWDVGRYGRPICSISLSNIGDIGLYLIRNQFSDYVTHWGSHPFMDGAYRSAAAR
jgi:endonuclease YncB( thermonuclease family)